MTAAKATKKIQEDFEGALQYWESHFDTWTFVHNSPYGIGPQVLKCLEDLKLRHPNITVNYMGYEALRNITMELPRAILTELFGDPPDTKALLHVRNADVAEVVKYLSEADPIPETEVKVVSVEKLDKNGLSAESKNYLQFGMHKSYLVESVFDAFGDPERAERVVQTFRARYTDLKSQELKPDMILSELIEFTEQCSVKKSLNKSLPKTRAAIAAVVAYLFERCDIFENPEGEN